MLCQKAWSKLSHFGPKMGQSELCESLRAMASYPAQATTPAPQNGTVHFYGRFGVRHP
jgi:hypothetical protein